MEAIQGIITGILIGFLIFYSLQPLNPYPKLLLDISEKPWLLILMLIGSWFLFNYDRKISILLVIILIMVIIDIEFLGRKTYK
jgi:hypothetical protein